MHLCNIIINRSVQYWGWLDQDQGHQDKKNRQTLSGQLMKGFTDLNKFGTQM